MERQSKIIKQRAICIIYTWENVSWVYTTETVKTCHKTKYSHVYREMQSPKYTPWDILRVRYRKNIKKNTSKNMLWSSLCSKRGKSKIWYCTFLEEQVNSFKKNSKRETEIRCNKDSQARRGGRSYARCRLVSSEDSAALISLFHRCSVFVPNGTKF